MTISSNSKDNFQPNLRLNSKDNPSKDNPSNNNPLDEDVL